MSPSKTTAEQLREAALATAITTRQDTPSAHRSDPLKRALGWPSQGTVDPSIVLAAEEVLGRPLRPPVGSGVSTKAVYSALRRWATLRLITRGPGALDGRR